MPSFDNKRIAKNTLFLYVRMILTIIVNLYTVRVIWQVLGIENYGIYNVVGGIVTMFSFLNNAMVASSQRFISFELGTGNHKRLNKVFSISVTIHFMLAFAILILAETIGLWFLNERLNIPIGRMTAANWVYQCSILAFMLTVVSVPYNACIVAHEHMKAYGYFGIIEVAMKLTIVFLLLIIPFDKLIIYSTLVVLVSLLMRVIYGWYCYKNFSECRYKFVPDHHLMRDMFSFAGWSFIGNMGFSVRDQGLNIVLNMFFNVTVNAAKGIANQIGAVVFGFSQSFIMAVNPQITKRYAAGEMDSMRDLVLSGCKFSAILMTFIVVPLLFACPIILKLWLGEVALYTSGFLRLILIMILIDSMVGPITTALQATGRIKWFQILVSIIMLTSIPSAWIALTINKTPYIVMYVSITTSSIALVVRLILLHRQIGLSYSQFFSKVVIRLLPIIIISLVSSGILYHYIAKTLFGLMIFFSCSIIITLSFTYFLGLETEEKMLVRRKFLRFFGDENRKKRD